MTAHPATATADPLKAEAVRVLELLLDRHGGEEFLAMLADEATWTIPGRWPGISGTHDNAGIAAFVRRVLPAGFPRGVAAEIHHVHRDGDTVALELTARATTSRGRSYENSYCFVFEFDNGKVRSIREYMDTMYADAVLHR